MNLLSLLRPTVWTCRREAPIIGLVSHANDIFLISRRERGTMMFGLVSHAYDIILMQVP